MGEERDMIEDEEEEEAEEEAEEGTLVELVELDESDEGSDIEHGVVYSALFAIATWSVLVIVDVRRTRPRPDGLPCLGSGRHPVLPGDERDATCVYKHRLYPVRNAAATSYGP